MSNAMSLSKSRWKGALLATVAASVLTPLAANAQSMQVQLSLCPLGTVGMTGVANGQSTGYENTEYIAPDSPVKIYVYATVSETAPVTSSNIAGLEYLYYNVNTASTAAGLGSVTGTTLNSALQFSQSNGTQAGAIVNSGGLAVGAAGVNANSTTATLAQLAKPRAAGGVFSDNSHAGDNTNIIVSGNTASFLVETLTYTPTFTPTNIVGNPVQSTTFSVSVPSALPSGYASANYFTGLSSDLSPLQNQSGGTFTQNSNYSASAASVTLIDAELGDAALVGQVTLGDFITANNNFGVGKFVTGWTNANFDGANAVDLGDFIDLNNNFGVGKTYGPGPSGEIASPSAGIAGSSVPEPTSLGFLAVAGLGLLRRRSSR